MFSKNTSASLLDLKTLPYFFPITPDLLVRKNVNLEDLFLHVFSLAGEPIIALASLGLRSSPPLSGVILMGFAFTSFGKKEAHKIIPEAK